MASCFGLLAAFRRDILGDMQKPYVSARLLLVLVLLILFHPAPGIHAAGQQNDALAPAAAPPEPGPQALAVGYFYTIRSGDTLWDIALAHDITLDELLAVNTAIDPQRLLPGETVFVPARPATVPQRVPAAVAIAAPKPSTAAPSVAPALAGPPPAIAGWPAEILALINEKRAAFGVPALTWSAELTAAAQAHAEDCRRRGWGSHVGSDGARLGTRLARAGYVARWAGENWANARGVQQAMEMWWNEPPGADPHRSNILSPMYREIGIGIVAAPWGYYFFTDFGSR